MSHPADEFRPEPGSVPDSPGCYLFRDDGGRVVYVGKAKSLRSRLANYFGSVTNLPARTHAMLTAACAVEWIVVESEVDALHLEYTLIQRHRPRYNIQYRDDKSYPYLVLTTSQQVPRARVQRGRVDAGDRRFGPYAHAHAIRETLDLLLRVFPVRSCTQGTYDRAERTGQACLLHHIERCAAPCTGAITMEAHRELVDGMAAFLDGSTAAVFARLEDEMRTAAGSQRYEVAARRRDQLEAARQALAKQQVVGADDEQFDVIGLHEDELEAAVQAFFVRHGRLVGRKGWTVDKVEPLDTDSLLTATLTRLYADRADEVPGMILVPALPADSEVLADHLTRLRRDAAGGRAAKVRFHVPRRGPKAALLRTVEENARDAFARSRLKRANDFDSRTRALRELQERLGLARAPLRIECFDVSHLAGTEVVASMVVFEDGLPRKSDYRRFKVRIDANDDVAAMREVLSRRFSRDVADNGRDGSTGINNPGHEDAVRWLRPDLVIVDGGRAQLGAAVQAVEATGADDVGIVALAKRLEELWLPQRSRPVILPRGSAALYLVQRLRDEAHRFAVTYQRQRRRAAVTGSVLDTIPGIGPERRKALLRRFGSVRGIAGASVAELEAVPGISHTLAGALLERLDRTEGDG